MRESFQPRQTEEPAGALDGVHEPEDIPQDGLVVRILLEADELGIDGVEVLAAFGQELAQKVVHRRYSDHACTNVRAEASLPVSG